MRNWTQVFSFPKRYPLLPRCFSKLPSSKHASSPTLPPPFNLWMASNSPSSRSSQTTNNISSISKISKEISKWPKFIHQVILKRSSKIKIYQASGSGTEFDFNAEHKTFLARTGFFGHKCEFHILADVEFKKSPFVHVSHRLQIATVRMRLLQLYEYFEDDIVLPGPGNLNLKCYIKKVGKDVVEIFIPNPGNVDFDGE